LAQHYLDEHNHVHPRPKSLDLPVAHWDVMRGRTLLADPNQVRYTSRARIGTNLYGFAVGDVSADTVSCARPPEHTSQLLILGRSCGGGGGSLVGSLPTRRRLPLDPETWHLRIELPKNSGSVARHPYLIDLSGAPGRNAIGPGSKEAAVAVHRFCLGGSGRDFALGLVAKSTWHGSDCRTRDRASHHRHSAADCHPVRSED
jgi:hypothetical protein